MNRIYIIFLLILVSLSSISASANNKLGRQALIEKYTKQLQTASSARDSVRILYYIFDLGDRATQMEVGWELYYTAGRADNQNAQLDMLRNLGSFYANDDSIISLLLSLADKVPNEESRAATRTFILNQQIVRKSRNPNDTHLQKMLLDSITKSHNLEGKDVYDRISLLYQIIQYLGVDADGVLFKECLDTYAELIEDLPISDFPLKNQFYTSAAVIHSRMNGNHAKAIEYDRKLLDIIDQLQVMYTKKKRKFRNYDANKFISYRRMLGNYSALTSEEIEVIHDSLMALYERDADVKRVMDREGQAHAFYCMATKNYKEAIPSILTLVKNTSLSAYQLQKYYGMLIEASKAVGDNQAYVEGMEQYIKYSSEIDSLRRMTMQREIMLRDSIITRPLLYKEKKVTHITNREHIKFEQTLMIVASALAILLIIYVVLYIRLRQRIS